MSRPAPPARFGISYPVRKIRILLSALTLFAVLYFFGSVLVLIPASVLVSAVGSWGWLITAVLVSAGIWWLGYRGYRNTLQTILADATEATAQTHPNLSGTLDLVQREANRRGMGTPAVYIHPEPAVNALAIGRRSNGQIVIFEGLLTQLDDKEELNAIVGHELAHLDNRDSVLMATLTGIKRLIVLSCAWVGYFLRKGFTEFFGGVDMTPAAKQTLRERMQRRASLVCSPIGLCEKSISRHREYIADAEGARITSPDAMADAIETVGTSDHKLRDADIPQSLCIFGANSGFLSQLRSTHPPVEKRIRYVQEACEWDSG